MPENKFPEMLETPRLNLKPIGLQYLDFIYVHFSDPDVCRYLLDEEPVKNMDEAKGIIEFFTGPQSKGCNRWMIERKEDGQVMGTVGFHHWDQQRFRAEIGYDMRKAFWGHGYMSEAVTAALDAAFYEVGLNRVEAMIYGENLRSSGLVKRMGFQQEGLLRDYFYLNGQFYDHFIFSLLKRDWQKRSVK